MKVVFMGAPVFAVPALRTLSSVGVEIAAVYTRAPRQGGRRGLGITKTPVHLTAEEMGLRVETPTTFKSPEALHDLRQLQADFGIVAAYGLLLPAAALAAFRFGCYNLHASLLPRWRGAAPVQRAIMAGDAQTGVSIMKMEVGLDTGPIAGEKRTPIDPYENSEELTLRLSELAAQTLGENWRALVDQTLVFAPQSSVGVEYARKIDKAEGPIDWRAPAHSVRGHIHGLAPFPGATVEIQGAGAAERLKILRGEVVAARGAPGEILDEQMTIACGEGAIRVLEAQRPGRSVVSGIEFMRSRLAPVGQILPSRT